MKLTEERLRRAVKSANRRYYDMIAERIADRRTASRKGRHLMKKTAKFVLGAGIAAAVLGAGGYAAMVALRNNQGIFGEESRDIRSMIEEMTSQSTSKNTSESSKEVKILTELHLPLTDQQDEQGIRIIEPYSWMHGCTASDTGWYFTDMKNVKGQNTTDAIWYSHNESDECVILCSRANCLHDGNEYCTATTSAYVVGTDPVWLEGYLYAVAMKPYGKNYSPYAQYGNIESAGSFVLLRYAPDGSEVTEIAEILPKTEEDFMLDVESASIIAHRGQIWFSFLGRSWCRSAPEIQREFYRMGVYTPQDGTATELLADEKPDRSSVARKGAPDSLAGDGDYVYFRFDAAGRWDDGNRLRTGIWRISCVTGELEQMYSCEPRQIPRTYFVCGDKMVFSVVNENASEKAVTSQLTNTDYRAKDYLVYDMTTGETRRLLSPKELGTDPANYEDRYNYCGFRTDGKRMYLQRQTETTDEIWVVEFDGTVQKIPLPTDLEWKDYSDELYPAFANDPDAPDPVETASTLSWKNDLLLHDGRLYVRYLVHWYSIAADDLIGGGTDWQPEFRHSHPL